MAEKGTDSVEDSLAAMTIQKARPNRITERTKTGFFYRFSGADVVGVYAKSVKHHGLALTDDDEFKKIRDKVQQTAASDNNCLGVCFFGVWSYRAKKKKKDVNWITLITIPVRRDKRQGGILIWKTQHIPAGECSPFYTTSGDFEYMQWKEAGNREEQKKHTEEKAIEFLKLPQTQERLWKELLKQANDTVPPKSQFISCKMIGFHFLSSLDSCDHCLEQLISFQRNDRYNLPSEIESRYDPVPFIITFTSVDYYNYHLYNVYNITNNSIYSASLMFYPSCQRLYKYKELKKKEIPKYTPSEEIKHQEAIELEDGQELAYIILNVKEGEPVKVKYEQKFEL